jgi:hypothetical protein
MVEILGTTYYTTGQAKILFFILSPVAIFFTIWLVRRLFGKKRPPVLLMFMLVICVLIGLFAVLHWDIYQAGQQITPLCREQAGMHIYKRVTADSVAGSMDPQYWSEYGFSFVEDIDRNGHIRRGSLVNGRSVIEPVNEMASQYLYKVKDEEIKGLNNRYIIYKKTHYIIDRNNKEILGNLIIFSMRPGWADHWLPGVYHAWRCGDNVIQDGNIKYLTLDDLIKATVEPMDNGRSNKY